MRLQSKMKRLSKSNKKGVSGVIATVLMVALVMAIAVVVWVVVRGLVQDQIGSVESCFDVYDKVKINGLYTCYDSVGGVLRFSINVGDVELNKILVSISSAGSTDSYELSDTDQTLLDTYPTTGGEVLIPGKNSGKTYSLAIAEKPDVVLVYPIIGSEQCEVSDSLSNIGECSD